MKNSLENETSTCFQNHSCMTIYVFTKCINRCKNSMIT